MKVQKRNRSMIYIITALNVALSALIVWFVNGYNDNISEQLRIKREAEIEKEEKEMAEKALKDGGAKALPPLNQSKKPEILTPRTLLELGQSKRPDNFAQTVKQLSESRTEKDLFEIDSSK